MDNNFPQSFIFGVSDADLQVIGEANVKMEESEQSMWQYFSVHKGIDTPAHGIDRYNKWQEDVLIMKDMGLKHYRTSVAMNRILQKNGSINFEALKWYKKYFSYLKKQDIHIYTTLYHWELPQFLAAKGGWTNRETISWFQKHAKAVVENLGEYIDEFFLLNEPWVCSFLAYYHGIHAPGEHSLKLTLQAMHNMLVAQGVVCRDILSIDKNAKVGTVMVLHPSYSLTQKKEDILAAKYYDENRNIWFMDAMYLGKYPELMMKKYGDNLPHIEDGDMEKIKIGHLLYTLGINYYHGQIVSYDSESELGFKQHTLPGSITNDLDWPVVIPPVYQQGLYDILNQIYYQYKSHGLKRIYVTENGFAQETQWNGKDKIIDDHRRINYLYNHIIQVQDAIKKGVPVKGYFVWTLMDNYEWDHGYSPRSSFGLIHVDRKTMKRVWKRSAHWYKNVINSRMVTLN
ncbi:MAG: hypothetical protein A2233_04440 [Candidatus Kerfeldbacteria bacterium RIFOXYA2_FULL_38_24]|uniref:beta-glucosidase n=1 Tax=Candidatus Kerfeldbacteria bacterium RIFOXYB2_FULL_38_14 TaxID=1798547 RepID=A0A1G2BDR4_9BACT|nr:MAG: hypothetical protein A2233_04440 [Candidatus Kerfeldbacteria bacterium RIFOXYA2_FULL_38_24]OGY86347.1 MAG: hypothetical protein A2319_03040 [Candidatus Kerfeldbacteria bacterium RIFOXYB2_FULL_38_14]OGY89856.1 MAG: hypothetical protein A2458_05010 [Candidatus Kerfeldbacteria bacterium RIFOXYC2_FULL_38_9]